MKTAAPCFVLAISLALAGCDRRQWSESEIRDIAQDEAGAAAPSMPNISGLESRLSTLEVKAAELALENAKLRTELAEERVFTAEIAQKHNRLNDAHNKLLDHLQSRGIVR